MPIATFVRAHYQIFITNATIRFSAQGDNHRDAHGYEKLEVHFESCDSLSRRSRVGSQRIHDRVVRCSTPLLSKVSDLLSLGTACNKDLTAMQKAFGGGRFDSRSRHI